MSAMVAAGLAFLLGVGYAAISAYWALGGSGLLDTVGGVFERAGRSGGASIAIVLWTVVVVKLVAAVLPLLVVARPLHRGLRRALRVLAWVEATILTGYGLVLTGGGLLVQAGMIRAGSGADHRALAWHAYLWDPWFLLWGLLVGIALLVERSQRSVERRPEPVIS
jgi:hypothetical protein